MGCEKVPECYLNGGKQIGLRDLSLVVPRVNAFRPASPLEETSR